MRGVLNEHPNFALVLEALDEGLLSASVVVRHDNYALCDYWATMFNIGKSTVDEVGKGLDAGLGGVPQDQNSRSEFLAARYDTERKGVEDAAG